MAGIYLREEYEEDNTEIYNAYKSYVPRDFISITSRDEIRGEEDSYTSRDEEDSITSRDEVSITSRDRQIRSESLNKSQSGRYNVKLNGITECFNQSRYSLYIVSDTLFLIMFILVEIILIIIIFLYL